jgi:oligopeptide/dipeptide ABC transporter ATP-binding protein
VRSDEARRRAVAALTDVGLDDPERRMRQYPHELSGGMLQRVMIAAAVIIEPRLIIADECTSALDVTTQAEVMAILAELRQERGMALWFITHDLDLATAVCDRTVVMYAGSVVEDQPSAKLADAPLHPYSSGLMGSRPPLEGAIGRLTTIGGRPIGAYEAPHGCAFAPRCRFAEERCRQESPGLRQYADGLVACHRAEDLRGIS